MAQNLKVPAGRHEISGGPAGSVNHIPARFLVLALEELQAAKAAIKRCDWHVWNLKKKVKKLGQPSLGPAPRGCGGDGGRREMQAWERAAGSQDEEVNFTCSKVS